MSAPTPDRDTVPTPHLRARDVQVARSGRWVVGCLCAGITAPAWAHEGLGRPGLWNRCPSRAGAWVFAWPEPALNTLRAVTDDDPTDRGVTRRYRSWMTRTFNASPISSWRAPSTGAVGDALAGERLLVRRGTHVRRIQLEAGAHRVALTCLVLPHISETLAEARLRWMDRLRMSAMDRRPCVRLGWCGTDAGRALVAEIDLSGAPAAWMPTLLVQALGVMRGCLAPLLEPLELLAKETERDLQFLAIHNPKETAHDTAD